MLKYAYFDVGGVAINDFSGNNGWVELRRSLGIAPDQDEAFAVFWRRYAGDVCTTLDVDDLIPHLNAELGLALPNDFSLLEAFVERFSPNEDIWPILRQLGSTMELGLLTNMYPRMFDLIASRKLLPPIQWHAVVDSSAVGFEKPDRRIFQIAQEKALCAPNEILFIDNSSEHLKASEEMGWNTCYYDPSSIAESNRNILNIVAELNGT